MGDHLRVPGQGIINRDKVRHQFAGIVHYGEVTLMGAHGRNQNFLRQLQVVLVETATDSRGVLRQLNDFIQKPFILTDSTVFLFGTSSNKLADSFSPLLNVNDYKPFTQGLHIAVNLSDLKRPRAHETMPVGSVATRDIAVSARDYFLAQQGNDPMYWSGKSNFQTAPAHGLGKGNILD